MPSLRTDLFLFLGTTLKTPFFGFLSPHSFITYNLGEADPQRAGRNDHWKPDDEGAIRTVTLSKKGDHTTIREKKGWNTFLLGQPPSESF